jgi:hypothetical protein
LQDHELITAQSRYKIVFSARFTKSLSNLLEQSIANSVA